MRLRRSRALSILSSVASTLSLTMVLSQTALAAVPAVPMVGEDFLSPVERQAVTDTMSAEERASLGHLFAPEATGLVIGYVRREFAVFETSNGGRAVEPIGVIRDRPTGAISVPAHLVAGTTNLTKPGTNLYISLTLVKIRSTSPYEWQVYEYAQWGVNGSYSPAGMDCCNNVEDTMAAAWGGGLALHSDAESGKYQAWCVGEPSIIDIYKSDVANNIGVGHSFHEWWDPDNCPMYYGWVDSRIRENRWRNMISNVSMKYFHTWGVFNYSVSFGVHGPQINISPTTAQWSAVLSLSFTH